MKRNAKKTARKFTPAAWQWDPSTLRDMTLDGRPMTQIQFWTASGSMSIVSVKVARELVVARAAFCGSDNYICQVHDGIDGSNV